MPFAPFRQLECRAFHLAKGVDTVILAREYGLEILAAVVVDHLDVGFVAIDDGCDNRPAKRVFVLAQIARLRSQDVLPGNDDVLLMEVDAHEDLVFTIIKVRAEWRQLSLCMNSHG